MWKLVAGLAVIVGTGISLPAQAQAPSVTATCKDGTAFSGATRSGACRGHKGVQSWDTPSTSASVPAASSTTTPATPSVAKPASPAATGSIAGTGQVWVNTKSKVYHCSGDRDYGHTKQGAYMTEAAAQAEGDRPSRGRACF